jgi:hypothetical protein
VNPTPSSSAPASPAGPARSGDAGSTGSAHPLAVLREPGTVRARCAAVLRSVEDNLSPYFTLDRSRLDTVAERVAAVTRRRYPDLRVPLHSRWRHFEAGGVDRRAELEARLAGFDTAAQARTRIDLTVLSVLLDAGAGPQWRYTEGGEIDRMALPLQQRGSDELLALLDRVGGPRRGEARTDERAAAPADAAPSPPAVAVAAPPAAGTDDPRSQGNAGPPQVSLTPSGGGLGAAQSWGRSEGLAVASFRAFMAGAFSITAGDPLRADATALKAVDATALRALFQSNPTNPLLGLEGRAALVVRLGEAVAAEAAARSVPARPGQLWDLLTAGGTRREVAAIDILRTVLRAWGGIWRSGGSLVQGLPAGDVWPHRWAGAATADGGRDATTGGWVPFHKLAQWLAWSLIEPLQWAGIEVTGLDALTGLPEYRNGGLLLDAGVIVPRSATALARSYKIGDEFVVEWRALTVALLDELAPRVRRCLGPGAETLSLGAILEGGTWAAGREIARELRPDGGPPLRIDSDGTIF